MERSASRRQWLVALPALLVVACANRRGSGPRPINARVARTPAAGRPATCPDDAVDVYGDQRPGPMDLRCSYADAAGGQAVQLSGRVREAPQGHDIGDGLGHVAVQVHATAPDGSLGPIVAEATTDAQGAFSVAALLDTGEYVLVVPALVPGPPRATRRFELTGGQRQLGDLVLLVPRPDAP